MANDFSAFIPEWWAMGALAILNENLVTLPLVNKDFSDQFASGGQVVNTRRPNKMVATRKHQATGIAAQDVSATNVVVPLNQQIYNSFVVQDLDQQWSMADLMQTYLAPAGFALAKMADQIVLGQAARFLYAGNVVGRSDQTVYQNIVDARVLMDNNLAYQENRHLVTSPFVEGLMLKDNTLIQQYSAGTTQALRAGIVGNLVGVDLYKTQISPANTVSSTGSATGTVAAATLVGATSFTANQTSPTFAAGDWIKLRGQPFKITAVAGGADPRTVTVGRAIPFALTTSDTFVLCKACTVSTNYVAGWAEPIVLAPSSEYVPAEGNFVEINGNAYAVVRVTAANTVLLDRPLETVITAASHKMATIPPGNYSFMFHRDCMTVAIRPLAQTRAGAGVLSAVANYNGLTVRAQMWYNGTTQTMQVSLDFLMGTQVLDTNLACVVCS